jgi:shikimate dehydrogenase
MRRFGLIGFPLTHSFSQKYFAEKFQLLGISDCVYENFPLTHINKLPDLLLQENLRGLNITIPYKKQVLSYLTNQSAVVEKIGACNCLAIQNGKVIGHNTDVYGFRTSLQPFLKSNHQQALIFGTGGASAAVAYVLEELGIVYRFVSRQAGDNLLDYASINESVLSTHQLLINTTPLGMYPQVDQYPDIPYELLTPDHHLYDLIYNPAETKFLELGRKQGATTQNGAEMLVLQAEESWRIWNEASTND